MTKHQMFALLTHARQEQDLPVSFLADLFPYWNPHWFQAILVPAEGCRRGSVHNHNSKSKQHSHRDCGETGCKFDDHLKSQKKDTLAKRLPLEGTAAEQEVHALLKHRTGQISFKYRACLQCTHIAEIKYWVGRDIMQRYSLWQNWFVITAIIFDEFDNYLAH